MAKNCFHNRIIKETQMANSQKNSARRFGENYLTNHLAKFLQDRIKP